MCGNPATESLTKSVKNVQRKPSTYGLKKSSLMAIQLYYIIIILYFSGPGLGRAIVVGVVTKTKEEDETKKDIGTEEESGRGIEEEDLTPGEL